MKDPPIDFEKFKNLNKLLAKGLPLYEILKEIG